MVLSLTSIEKYETLAIDYETPYNITMRRSANFKLPQHAGPCQRSRSLRRIPPSEFHVPHPPNHGKDQRPDFASAPKAYKLEERCACEVSHFVGGLAELPLKVLS